MVSNRYYWMALLLLIAACQREKPSANIRQVNGIVLSAKPLLDKKKEINKRSLSFLLSLRPEKNGVDLLRYNLTHPEEYSQRVSTLSFHMNNYLTIKVGEDTFVPTLAQYENLHDPSGKISIILKLVLEPSVIQHALGSSSNISLIFEDPYWQTGIHHFVFDQQDFIEA